MRPRALVVRSGARSLLDAAPPLRVEIVERVSHTIAMVPAAAEALEFRADLAIFTSQVAVAMGLGGANGALLRPALAAARIVAVGTATAAALREAGVVPEIVGGGSADSLLAALPARLAGVGVLFPCGEDASPALDAALRRRGAAVSRCVVYRKTPKPPDAALGAELVERPFAAFGTTSPAAARWLFEQAGPEALERLRETPAMALGPSTRAFLAERGVRRIEVAGDARFESALRLLEALATSAPGQ
ncbi:MAG TPA: uroporphyrinogen-III synthase [Thermoanaerobaculia bacterium]|jgi:uroporphyrinogen-III synthase